MSESQIVNSFTNKTIFLTGCTGFLGKLLVEKLLRVCCVKMIFAVVRQKKGKLEEDRFEEMFNGPIFTRMKEECPDYVAKVHLIAGDCALENLGIAEDNWKMLKEQTNVVIHCAATVRFDEALRTAYNINVRATRDLLNAAKEMKNLQSFIHISTAYSNCPRKDIDEKVYETPLLDQQLETFLNLFEDDGLVARMIPHLLGDWPNTYTFTKAIAEEMVVRMAQSENNDLPLAIVRPSIIISTYKEPVPGWIDNLYGPIGASCATGLGVLRTLFCIPECHMDVVPADYVVNSILATAWYTSLRSTKQVEIYNYVSGQYSLTIESYVKECQHYAENYRSMKTIWPVTLKLTRWEFLHRIEKFFLEIVPAHVVDFVVSLLGKKPIMIKIYRKLHSMNEITSYFRLRDWNFGNKKMNALWKHFNEEDKKLFEFRISTFDWQTFLPDYIRGGYVYLLHDPMDNVPKAKKRYQRLVIAHWTLVSFIVLLFAYILYLFYSIFV